MLLLNINPYTYFTNRCKTKFLKFLEEFDFRKEELSHKISIKDIIKKKFKHYLCEKKIPRYQKIKKMLSWYLSIVQTVVKVKKMQMMIHTYQKKYFKMGGEKKPMEISELGCADGCGREMGWENCADGCGRRGCKGVAGNGWGEEAAGDERARLRGWLRTGNGCGELCGRLQTAWVQRSGWKWVGRRSRW